MFKTKSLALILGVLIMSFLIGYLVFAWDDPDAPPPGNNVDAPLNVGSSYQQKTGGLGAGEFKDADDPNNYWINPAGGAGNYAALLKGAIQIGSLVPTVNYEGAIYYDSTNHKLKCYQGSPAAWVDCVGAGGAGLWTDAGTYIYPNNYTNFAITDTGKVGIGTTNPNTRLTISLPNTAGSAGRDVLEIAGGNTDAYRSILLNKPEIRFWSTSTSTWADIYGRTATLESNVCLGGDCRTKWPFELKDFGGSTLISAVKECQWGYCNSSAVWSGPAGGTCATDTFMDAYCPVGWYAVSGGGWCTNSGIKHSYRTDTRAWEVKCTSAVFDVAMVEVLCCR